MSPHIQSLLVLVLGIGYVMLTYSRARAILEQWATANGYEILHSEIRHLFTGPFFWRNFTKQPVYYVRVRERDGKERAGWVRCCVWWSGGSGTAEVRWDETAPLFRDSGSNSSFLTSCLRNRTIKIGLGLLILGTGPVRHRYSPLKVRDWGPESQPDSVRPSGRAFISSGDHLCNRRSPSGHIGKTGTSQLEAQDVIG